MQIYYKAKQPHLNFSQQRQILDIININLKNGKCQTQNLNALRLQSTILISKLLNYLIGHLQDQSQSMDQKNIELFTTYYGFKTSETSCGKCYHVTPVGIGTLSSLRQRFQVIQGNIQLKIKDSKETVQERLNPMFEYLMQQVIRYDFLSFIKPTEYEYEIKSQFCREDDGAQSLEIKDKISKIMMKVAKEQKNYQQNEKRIDKLMRYHSNIDLLWVQKEAEYLELSSKTHEEQQIGRKLCQAVRNLSPLRMPKQMEQYNLFQKIHQKYFSIQKRHKQSATFKIKKESQEHQAVIQTIGDQVGLRKKNQDVSDLSVGLIRDVGLLLKKYGESVSDSKKMRVYRYIDQKNIVFDQFSLRPHLKFQPLLLQALGLGKRPLSVQNLISFFPTPKGFDYFQSPKEIYPQTSKRTKVILSDPFYGCLQMYGQNIKRLSQKQLERIEEEKKEVQGLTEHLLCWKYLELSYYIGNGRYFGAKNTLCREKQIESHFVEQLKRVESTVKTRQALLSFLSIKDSPEQSSSSCPQQIPLSFSWILTSLSPSEPNDAFLASYRLQRIQTYKKIRACLLRQVIKTLVNPLVLVKIYNVKKYICIFMMVACEIMEEIRIKVEWGREDQRSEGPKEEILRYGKSNCQYLESTYQKIKGYAGRREKEDLQARFLLCDSEGIQLFYQVNKIKAEVDLMVELHLKTEVFPSDHPTQQNKSSSSPSSTKHSEDKQQLQSLLNLNYPKTKETCFSHIRSQLQGSKYEEYNKIPKGDANIRKSYNFFQMRLETMIASYFLASVEHLSDYDTLIVPLLRINQSQKNKPIEVVSTEGEERELQRRIEDLKIISDILKDYSENGQLKKNIRKSSK